MPAGVVTRGYGAVGQGVTAGLGFLFGIHPYDGLLFPPPGFPDSLLFLGLACGAFLAGDVPTTIADGPPEQGTVSLELEEMWRVGGEDGEPLFGRILDVLADPAGNILILDNQLCQVVVLSPDGEHLLDQGGPGEGPGEPTGMALLGEDLLSVGMPCARAPAICWGAIGWWCAEPASRLAAAGMGSRKRSLNPWKRSVIGFGEAGA